MSMKIAHLQIAQLKIFVRPRLITIKIQYVKPRPNALDISLDSARQMSSDVLLFQRRVAKRSRLSLDFSLDSSQTSVRFSLKKPAASFLSDSDKLEGK